MVGLEVNECDCGIFLLPTFEGNPEIEGFAHGEPRHGNAGWLLCPCPTPILARSRRPAADSTNDDAPGGRECTERSSVAVFIGPVPQLAAFDDVGSARVCLGGSPANGI